MAITLPVASDLYTAFGQANVRAWADADNDKDNTKIGNRITWGIAEASNYIVSRLALKFAVSDWTVFPARIFSLVVRRAGVELYKMPRAFTDGSDGNNSILTLEDYIETQLSLILGGNAKLIDLVEDQPKNVPGVNNNISSDAETEFGIEDVWMVVE